MSKRIFSFSIFICVIITIFEFDVNAMSASDVSSKAAILIEAKTGNIIYSKNAEERLPMASTTKIMTTLIALNQDNLDEKFEVDKDAIKIEGSSMGLQEGDKVSIFDLAYGMMLPSGNDAANVAAVKIAGSIPAFAKLMNQYAENIGMKNTNFTNPSGLHDDNHYSTAHDMALLMRAAMQNSRFRYVTAQKTATIRYGNPPYSRVLKNHNRLLSMYDYVIGGKTGFTTPAGRCLVSVAEKNGLTLIAVTLNDPDDWDDHMKMYEYGFKSLKPMTLQSNTENITIKVTGGEQDSICAKVSDNVVAYVSESDVSRIKKQILIKPFYYAPVMEGDVLGEVQYTLDGNVVAKDTILAGESVRQKENLNKNQGIFSFIKDIFGNIFDYIKGLFN